MATPRPATRGRRAALGGAGGLVLALTAVLVLLLGLVLLPPDNVWLTFPLWFVAEVAAYAVLVRVDWPRSKPGERG